MGTAKVYIFSAFLFFFHSYAVIILRSRDKFINIGKSDKPELS